MLRLAKSEGKWLLVKTGGGGSWEYWYILPNLRVGCLNNQSKKYGAIQALEHMTKQYGQATYVRPTIKSC